MLLGQLPREVTSPYGWRVHPISRKWKLHRGLDLRAVIGTPIHVPLDGVVTRVRQDAPGVGNAITVAHPSGFSTYYAHLSRIAVTIGQPVEEGEIIGETGTYGTGPHLHFGVYAPTGESIDPLAVFPPGYFMAAT